ncbi:MAG: aldo/keto reductase [Gemmatimonadetes bacterium]|nr:aldo/keto reductase [Gemmatimonadota bacterium]
MVSYRPLGRTGLNVSTLSMGSGGYNRLGQTSDPPLTEPEMHRLVHGVLDLGINLFDTSPGYLESEAILGRAFQGVPRDRFYVATRVVLSQFDEDEGPVLMTPEHITDSIETSLRRLGVDEIDVALIAATEKADFDYMINEQFPVLERLCQQGKIRFLGSSETALTDGAHEWLRAAVPTGKLDVIMIAYSMLNQSARHTVFPYCAEHHVGVMNIFSVRNIFKDPARLAQTIEDLQQQELLDESIDPNSPYDFLLEDPDIETLVEAAYRFVVYTEGVTTAVCSAVTLDKIEENIMGIAKGPLPQIHVKRIQRLFGHISEPVGN